MDVLNGLLASDEVQTAILGVVGLVLTVIINRAAGAFTLATGISVEKAHRDALHEAIKSGVESALRHGPKVAAATVQAHVIQHLKESVPDAMNALLPGETVIKRLIERYTLEALGRLAEPK